MQAFKANDRAQWFTRGAVGTIAAVINGGMAYLFHADSGAKFTVRADELSPIGSPDRKVPTMPAGECRTVFVFERPTATLRQRTPSQQQQAPRASFQTEFPRDYGGNTWADDPYGVKGDA